MDELQSNIDGISDRAFRNAVKAKIRDPSRPIRLLDFMTFHERQILVFTAITAIARDYEKWLNAKRHEVYRDV